MFGRLLTKERSLSVSEVCTLLDHIADLCSSACAKTVPKDLKIFVDALKPHADTSITSFCEIAKAQLGRPTQPASRRRTSVGTGAKQDDDAIKDHVMKLRNASNDRNLFDNALKS